MDKIMARITNHEIIWQHKKINTQNNTMPDEKMPGLEVVEVVLIQSNQ